MSYSVSWSAADVTEKSGRRPPGRFANAYTRYGSSTIVLHGGCSWIKGRKFRFLDDMWVLKISMPGRISWEALGQRGQVPGVRAYHHLCYLSRRLYLFGGKKAMEDKRMVPGMHVYDYSIQCWYQQHVSGAEHPFPLGCSASVVDDQIFTFGGMLDGKVTGAVHLFDPQASSWSALQPSGSIPPARCDHGACTTRSSVFVHGGCAGADVFLCDLYELDTNTLLWTRLEFGGMSNIPRAGHTLSAHHGKDLFVFGGFNDHIYPDGGPVTEDLCKYSLRQKRWKTPLAFPMDYEPSITYNHSAVIVQNNLYIVGGLALDGMANDVQVARLISPSERSPAPEAVRMKAFDSGFKSSGIYDSPMAPIVDEIYSSPMERERRPENAARSSSNARIHPLQKLPDIERRSETTARSIDSADSRSCSRASLDPVVSEIFIEPSNIAPAAAAPERGPRRLSSPPPILSHDEDDEDDEESGLKRLKSPPPGLTREHDDDEEEGGRSKLRSPPPGLPKDDEVGDDVNGHLRLKSPPPSPPKDDEDDDDVNGHLRLKSPPPSPPSEDAVEEDMGGHRRLKSPPPSPPKDDEVGVDVRGHLRLKSPPPSPSSEDAVEEDMGGHRRLKSPPIGSSREGDENAGGLLGSPPPSASDVESGRRAPEPPESVSEAGEEERKENAIDMAIQNLNSLATEREAREEDASTRSENTSCSDSTGSDSDEDSSSDSEEEEKEEAERKKKETQQEEKKEEEEEDEFSFSLSKQPEAAKPDEDGRAWSEDVYDEPEAVIEADNGNAAEDDSEQSGDEPTLTPEERQQLEQLSAQVSSK